MDEKEKKAKLDKKLKEYLSGPFDYGVPYECELTGVPGSWCAECPENGHCYMQSLQAWTLCAYAQKYAVFT